MSRRGSGISLLGESVTSGFSSILTPDALEFVAYLHRTFNTRRLELLQARKQLQQQLDAGYMPDFLAKTAHVRADGSWKCASIPADLQRRTVEITGPPDRKMMINALNSGANVFMVDFEDSMSPTWTNVVQGQVNVRDSVLGTIRISSGPGGKEYKLRAPEELATLMVRPRGWHLEDQHVLVDERPVSASLLDFGLFFFHCARPLLRKQSAPYFYLPKLESHLEARLWNDVFIASQKRLSIPVGTIRATVLIETILAAFEMDEILYELRQHSAGLNCGRWDYIFSFIKKFRVHERFVLPDREYVGMDRPFMSAYVRLLIETCHKRGVHAMGGMAAQIPIKNDAAKNAAAMDKVYADKVREVKAGHDGTWVAHPGLIPIARRAFDEYMRGGVDAFNQISFRPRYERAITAADLVDIGVGGSITLAGLRTNVDVGLRYLEAWLRGSGCVPLYNKMEDAATAEISRSQIWHWLHHKARLETGELVNAALVTMQLNSVLDNIRAELNTVGYAKTQFELAEKLYRTLMLDSDLHDFLTLDAYPFIVRTSSPDSTTAILARL